MATSEYTAVLRLLHHLTDEVVRLQGQVDSLVPADCFLPKRQAAEFLGWSLRTLDKHVSEIRHYKLRGRVFFKRSDLNAYVANFKIEPGPSEQLKLRNQVQEIRDRVAKKSMGNN